MAEKERRLKEKKKKEEEEERLREERFEKERKLLEEKYKRQQEEEKRKKQLIFEENAKLANKKAVPTSSEEETIINGNFRTRNRIKHTESDKLSGEQNNQEVLNKKFRERPERHLPGNYHSGGGMGVGERSFRTGNENLYSNGGNDRNNQDYWRSGNQAQNPGYAHDRNDQDLHYGNNTMGYAPRPQNLHLNQQNYQTGFEKPQVDDMKLKLLAQLEEVKKQARLAMEEKEAAERTLNSLKSELDTKIAEENDYREKLTQALNKTNPTELSGPWVSSKNQGRQGENLIVTESSSQDDFDDKYKEIAESIALDCKTKLVPMEALDNMQSNFSLRKIAENSYSKILKRKFNQSIISKDQNSLDSTTKKFEDLMRMSGLDESKYENSKAGMFKKKRVASASGRGTKDSRGSGKVRNSQKDKRVSGYEDMVVDNIDRMMEEYYSKNTKGI